MDILILLFLAISTRSLAADKDVAHLTHGRITVLYTVLKSSEHILFVSARDAGGSRNQRVKGTIALNIKKDEVLAVRNGFNCRSKDNKFVYGIVSKSRAKEKGTFQPERAWMIDEEKSMLFPIRDPNEVDCEWLPGGGEKFPFY